MTSIPQEKGSGYLKQFQAKMKTPFDPTGKKASEFEFYFGPNDFQILKIPRRKVPSAKTWSSRGSFIWDGLSSAGSTVSSHSTCSTG